MQTGLQDEHRNHRAAPLHRWLQKEVGEMKIVQVRFGYGCNLDYGEPDEQWVSDRFVTASEAEDIIRVYKSAKIINVQEIDIVLAEEFDPNAQPFR